MILFIINSINSDSHNNNNDNSSVSVRLAEN